jgi:hypothetical protein
MENLARALTHTRMTRAHFKHWLLPVVLLLGCGGEANLGDDDDYWAGPEQPTAGGNEPTLLYRGRRQVVDFTADEHNLYAILMAGPFTGLETERDVELVVCSVADCASDVRTLVRRRVPSGISFGSLSISHDELFWAEVESDGSQYSVWACPISGCEAGPRLLAESDSIRLGVDADFVYWISSASRLVRCSRSGCDAPEVLAEIERHGGLDQDSQIVATAGDYIYFRASAYDMRVFRVARAGGEAELLLADTVNLSRFDVTADSLYFSTSILAGEIKTCPLSGCPEAAAVLASNQRWPSDVSADPEGLFWVTKTRQMVNLMKLAPGQTEPVPLFTGETSAEPLIHAPLALYWTSLWSRNQKTAEDDLFTIHRLPK